MAKMLGKVVFNRTCGYSCQCGNEHKRKDGRKRKSYMRQARTRDGRAWRKDVAHSG
jgi:hypothetical protein